MDKFIKNFIFKFINKEFIQTYWIAFIPILLLNMIAIRQIYLHNNNFLNRWKGGGFGMFSMIEDRFYHVHLIQKKTFECAEISMDSFDDFDKIEMYPSYLKLEQLTRKLINRLWVYRYSPKKSKSVVMLNHDEKVSQDDTLAKFDSIEISVFKIKFYKKNFSVEPKLMRKMSLLK